LHDICAFLPSFCLDGRISMMALLRCTDLGLTIWKAIQRQRQAMGIVNSDPFTRVKLGPSHRQFLQTAAPRGAALLPASLGMDESFAQRRQHAGRLRAQPRRRDIEFDVSLGSMDSARRGSRP
jgi:hypothetical protein